ncbi:MAG: DUF819 family protein, partial [SAR86 cluster bacterium]
MSGFTDPLVLLGILALLVVISEWLVAHTALRHLGTALLVIVLAALIANLGIIPAASSAPPLYDGIFAFLAPVAIFFLLLEVNLRDLKRAGLPMVFTFCLGALGTIVGVLVASLVVGSEGAFGDLYYAINGMFTGTFIGGSLNFNAIALNYDVTKSGEIYAGAVVVDNIYTMVWMLVTLALPRIFMAAKQLVGNDAVVDLLHVPDTDEATVAPWDLAVLMALGCVALAFANFSTNWLLVQGINLPMIIILSTVALVLAQFPAIGALRGSRTIGLFGVYLFLAVIGAYAEFSALANIGNLAYSLVLFVGIILTVHGVIIFGVGRLFRQDWELLAIVSQANIGGQTTAIALCRTFNRPELFLPAILIGSLG